jgi:hypothetical protein
MIDLCKVFGVEEGEEFEFNKYKGSRYKVSNGCLKYLTGTDKCWVNSAFEFNEAIGCEVIKLPKKKEFTDDELAIMRSLPKEYKWMARDDDGEFYIFTEKPKKFDGIWDDKERCNDFYYFEHLFKSITSEDEEPVFIDDYVERGAENE